MTSFFEIHSNDYVEFIIAPHRRVEHISVERLYQEFKERLVAELKVQSPELLNQAEIVDTEQHF